MGFGKLKILIWSLAVLAVLLLVFQLGIFVGLKKAGFIYQWEKNYSRNFGDPPGWLSELEGEEILGTHGTAGAVIKVDQDSLVIKDRHSQETVVNINKDTIIRYGKQTINLADVKVDEGAVIIGTPSGNGAIEAKLIRILPPLDDALKSS